jgi:hypothetical protein
MSQFEPYFEEFRAPGCILLARLLSLGLPLHNEKEWEMIWGTFFGHTFVERRKDRNERRILGIGEMTLDEQKIDPWFSFTSDVPLEQVKTREAADKNYAMMIAMEDDEAS